MAQTFQELMQEFVNEDYDTLVEVASNAVSEILPTCKEVDQENDGFLMLTSIVITAIASDGNLTSTERRFLKDVFGFTDDHVDTLVEMYDKEMFNLVDSFADAFTDIKATVLVLITAIAACDETISREETAFIRDVIA